MLPRKHAKHLYLKFSKKIKSFLLSAKSREFLIFLFFVFIATGFWLLQTLDNEYETEIAVPIQLNGVPEDIVITSEPISEIGVKVKDRGTVLFNYWLKQSFPPVIIDFDEEAGKNNHVKMRSWDIERKVMSQLNVSTRLLGLSSDSIDYIYSDNRPKYVPVHMVGKAVAARQY